jgi:hypothetical protein
MIYLLTAVGLTPGDSSAVHIYTLTIHITTQLTTLVGRLTEFAEKKSKQTGKCARSAAILVHSFGSVYCTENCNA